MKLTYKKKILRTCYDITKMFLMLNEWRIYLNIILRDKALDIEGEPIIKYKTESLTKLYGNES